MGVFKAGPPDSQRRRQVHVAHSFKEIKRHHNGNRLQRVKPKSDLFVILRLLQIDMIEQRQKPQPPSTIRGAQGPGGKTPSVA